MVGRHPEDIRDADQALDRLCPHGVLKTIPCEACIGRDQQLELGGDPDVRYLGIYGTVMCSFGPPIACYPFQDPDLQGKKMIIIGPPPAIGDEILGLPIIGVRNLTGELELGRRGG